MMKPCRITTLDKREITLCFDEVVSPQTLRLIEGEGMPCTSSAFKTNKSLLPLSMLPKGDLYVRFDIQFPTNLQLD